MRGYRETLGQPLEIAKSQAKLCHNFSALDQFGKQSASRGLFVRRSGNNPIKNHLSV